jgi:hypothetical protein
MSLLDFIKSIYREEFDEKIKSVNLMTRGLSVVEFYLENNKYYIDIDNKVYTQDLTKNILHGIEIGYLRDGIIYIGS